MAFDLFDDVLGAIPRAIGIEPSGLPLVGSLFDDPNAARLQQQFRKMMENYQQYREPLAQGRMNALGNQLSIFGPVNDQIQHMYGRGAGFDTSQLMQNPMPQGMTQIGAPPPRRKPPGGPMMGGR